MMDNATVGMDTLEPHVIFVPRQLHDQLATGARKCSFRAASGSSPLSLVVVPDRK